MQAATKAGLIPDGTGYRYWLAALCGGSLIACVVSSFIHQYGHGRVLRLRIWDTAGARTYGTHMQGLSFVNSTKLESQLGWDVMGCPGAAMDGSLSRRTISRGCKSR
ncbi:hypothetical protein BRADI_2g42875v3 [Brachypodium distachyon]|uniref:Uncharacterized protein n=1 Tax=Brachypodium distachyon TaxID=15368 RepID=A0A2K2DDH6_BRADI|nr:hypothetical protein BRADI_2g42875v3 [Brachypodium distachyon]